VSERKQKWNATTIILTSKKVSAEFYDSNCRELAEVLYEHFRNKNSPGESGKGQL